MWDYIEWGGAQIHLFALINEVKKHFPVTVIIPENSDEQLIGMLRKLGVEIDFLPFHRDISIHSGIGAKLKMHWTKLANERKLVEFLRKYPLKNSVLHIDLPPWQSFLALRALTGTAGQVFVTMHNRVLANSALRRLMWKIKMALIARRKNFHILASNKDAAEALRDVAPAEFTDRIKVTYTSINPPEIDAVLSAALDREALCRKFGLAPDKFTVLCVGQFVDRKGRWTFLEAAQKLILGGTDIQFVWISNSKLTAEDQARIESYGLGDNFKLISNDQIGPERHDLLMMYRLCDVFVLASYVEGLPIALLEAMALKRPIISTNINGIPEAVKHLDTGMLIEPGDSDALAECIVTLKNFPVMRLQLAENGRQIVLREFDEREAARTALRSYLEAFGREAATIEI